MGLYLKITAGLLLLVQAFHLASLQNSTTSPTSTRTIPQAWLRVLKKTAENQNDTVVVEGGDVAVEGSSNEYSSGTASGFMAVNDEEEGNVARKDKGSDQTTHDLTAATTTAAPTFPANVRTKQPELPDATTSPNAATTHPTNPSQINTTESGEELHNSATTPENPTTHPRAQNSTGSPDHSARTDLQTTTSAPESSATPESTTKPDNDKGMTKATESTSTTVTTTKKPVIKTTSTTSSSTAVFPSETTEKSPETTTAAAPITPEKANKTASGKSSERGVTTNTHTKKQKGALGVVLGTAVAVTIVGLVAYIILNRKHRKGFSHSKLVEEYPSDPVLRLDNNDPLDLNFGVGGSAYYNPGLQGDNIQMSNLPGRR